MNLKENNFKLIIYSETIDGAGVKVVIVSVIGKSSHSSFGHKVKPLSKLFNFNTDPKKEVRISCLRK